MRVRGTASSIKEGQFGTFTGAVTTQLWAAVKDMDTKRAQYLIQHQEELQRILQEAFARPEVTPAFSWDMRWKCMGHRETVLSLYDLELTPFLKGDENYIDGSKMDERAKELGADLGSQQARYLLEHQDEIPEEWGVYRLLFIGEVWRFDNGPRGVFCLDRSGERWHLNFHWFSRGFLSSHRLVRERWKCLKDAGDRVFSPDQLELIPVGAGRPPNREWVDGMETVRRAKRLGADLGLHQAKYLLEHQDEIPDDWCEHRLIFPGPIWKGDRSGIPCLVRRVRYWELSFPWAEDGFKSNDCLVRQKWRCAEEIGDTVFSPDDLELAPFLKGGENYIDGSKMDERAKELGADLGECQARRLLERQDEIPDDWQRYRLLLLGPIRHGHGNPYGVPCLYWTERRCWRLDFRWRGDKLGLYDRWLRPR